MTRYHVFSGAPAARDVATPPCQFEWRIVSSHSLKAPPLTLPPTTLAAANRRISMMYENVIFAESQEDNDLPGFPDEDASHGNEEVPPGASCSPSHSSGAGLTISRGPDHHDNLAADYASHRGAVAY